MSFQWETPPDEAFGEMIDDYTLRVRKAVYTLAMRYAPNIETWLKKEAPWVDRSGNARQTLYSEVEQMVDLTIIHFSHGVTYGKYLELSHGGRYAIIGPALDHFAPLVWRDVQKLMGS